MKKFALSVLSLIVTFNSFSCSDGGQAAFGATNYPDIPFNSFAAGKLGVLTPKLASSYLIVAYRYLNKRPLSSTEQRDVLTVWSDYFSTYSAYPQPVYPLTNKMDGFCTSYSAAEVEIIHSADLAQFIAKMVSENQEYFKWRESRLSALGLPIELPMPKPKESGEYEAYEINSFYSNLALKEDHIDNIDAGPGFNYLILASERLNAIKEALNASPTSTKRPNDPEPKELLSLWINAQQHIFARTMDSGKTARALLASFPEHIPQVLKDDIQYSIAASYLYDGSFDSAKSAADLFENLSKNKNYRWHDWAKYLQYRALNIAISDLLQSSDVDTSCAENTECRRMSDKSYEGMLDLSKNASAPKIREAAADYANLISIRTKWRAQKSYEALLKNSLSNITEHSFNDLIAISTHTTSGNNDEVNKWFTDVMSVRTSEEEENRADLAQTSFNHAYTHWNNAPQNLAWLWLAVYTIKYAEVEQQNALTKAVLSVPKDDSAFVPLRVALVAHFDDIKNNALDEKQKRQIIDDTLSVLEVGADFNATILLLNARASLATSLTDFIDHAFFYPKSNLLACVPQRMYDKKNAQYNANYLVANAEKIINALPPSVLIQIASMHNLPDNYRPMLYADLWARSILLDDAKLEHTVIEKVLKYNPILTKTIRSMAKTKNPDERKTLFLSALLQYPDLSPLISLKGYQTWNGDNAGDFSFLNSSMVLQHEELDTFYNHWLWGKCDSRCQVPIPGFLSPIQQKEFQAQLKLITRLKGATDYISDALIELANHHRHDTRYAKLLALFIKYTKYTHGGSKQAFITLKKIYPHSDWAKNTKYYY